MERLCSLWFGSNFLWRNWFVLSKLSQVDDEISPKHWDSTHTCMLYILYFRSCSYHFFSQLFSHVYLLLVELNMITGLFSQFFNSFTYIVFQLMTHLNHPPHSWQLFLSCCLVTGRLQALWDVFFTHAKEALWSHTNGSPPGDACRQFSPHPRIKFWKAGLFMAQCDTSRLVS